MVNVYGPTEATICTSLGVCSAATWDRPILGDPIYGAGGPPLHLHARAIGVPLYRNKAPVTAEAPLPAHMAAAFAGVAP